jgi:hypothetical protein
MRFTLLVPLTLTILLLATPLASTLVLLARAVGTYGWRAVLASLAVRSGDPTAIRPLFPAGAAARAGETGGIAWELITGFVTAPSSTQTALTMSTGDSLAIRSGPLDKMVRLVQLWTDQQTAGVVRARSPKLHDNVQGIRYKATASDTVPLLPWGAAQRLYPTDVLAVDLSGSATAGDIESAALLVQYDDLPGVSGRFITADEVNKRALNLLTVENTLSLGTAGGWSGSEAINAEYDLFKANTDYALIGYMVDTECLAVAWRGADTGNLRVGGPGNDTLRHVTAEWFMRLSKGYGLPAVPVFNSLNKAGISIDGTQDENGADPLVQSLFVELSPR